MHTTKENITLWAKELGFQEIGFAKAAFLEEEAPRLEKWLKSNFHAGMKYMENWLDKRLDPRLLVEGATSVIVLTYNYHQVQKQRDPHAPKISQYAYGIDYHYVIRDKLNALIFRIQERYGEISIRGFVDSAPVMERTWAKKAGIGWSGKHTLLIQKQKGSYFFIATLILDMELEADTPFKTDHCGDCTRCIDACPTEAIIAPNLLDAGKCISYLTIELKDAIPDSFKGQFEGWAFGCDICQEVCPWNRFSLAHQEPLFQASEEFLEMNSTDWEHLTKETFNRMFKNSPLKRTKWSGLLRNIQFLKENNKR